MPTSPISTPAPPAVQHYAQLLEEQYPGYLSDSNETIGDAYIRYMRQHPSANPKTVYDTVIARLKAVAKLPGVIGGAIGKTATILGKLGPATGVGLAKASQDITGGLNLGNLMLRAGEVLLGIVLIGVALAHITGADNVVSKAAKTAGKVALL